MTDPTQAQSAPDQGQPDPTSAASAVAPAAPTTAPDPSPATVPTSGDGPWANDLAQLFPDEATRGQVDQFLRSKVQPYTTQLEQRASGAQHAIKLIEDLNSNPIDTYVQLTYEMYGEQAAQDVLNTLQSTLDTPTQEPPVTDPTQQTPPTPADPRFEQVAQWVEQQQAQTYYDGEMGRIVAAHPEVQVWKDAAGQQRSDLDPFVGAADGNFDKAYELYTAYAERFAQARNLNLPTPTPAPPVMGSDSTGISTPPVEAKNQTLDQAIAEFMAENRPNAVAPPVT